MSTTTATLTQRSTTRDEQDEQQELISRGLLNTDYPLLKKVVSEQMVISIAGLTAVLLQIAHPGVGKGVGDHSNFSYRFIERSENTAMYIYTMIFGSEGERAAMKRFVDKRHKYVNDKKKGNTYDALDPELQLWVAITLYGTYVPAYESIFGPFPSDQAEQLLQEFSIMGTSLQVPLHMWPRSVAEFNTYWNHIVNDVLEMTPQCAKTAEDLKNPVRSVPWYYKPLLAVTGPLHWIATTENLPPRARELFGLKSTATTKSINMNALTMIRWTYPYYPDFVRTWPKNYYLYLTRKHMKKGRLS